MARKRKDMRERKKGDEEGGKQEKLYLIHSTQEEF